MRFLISALIIGFFIIGCTRHSGEHAQEASKHEISEATGVKLDNGERWKANTETTDGINNMISLIASFQTQESQDYAALKENLQVEFKTIFQKCTMKGEAHDQLHTFLIPVKKELDQLSAENISELKAYLETYSDFFQ